MKKITSADNQLIKQMKALKTSKQREKSGMMLVEGEVMIREALKCGLEIVSFITDEAHTDLAEELNCEGAIVTEALLTAVCETKTPQGICACFKQPEAMNINELPDHIVALDGVQDPGNVGTIWRTADSAGFTGLLAGAGTCDLMSPKVMRAAMGSGFRIPFAYSSDLAETLIEMRSRGYHIIASDLRGNDFYDRPDEGERFVLVIGNEARGISQAVKDAADMRVKLPMRGGAESLNASVAAGIMMYEIMRKKYHK